jgi:hypothetical protein
MRGGTASKRRWRRSAPSPGRPPANHGAACLACAVVAALGESGALHPNTQAFEAAGAAEEEAIEALRETVHLTWLGVRCALAYLVEMQDGYHLRDFIPTLLESPLFAVAGEA